MVRSTDIRLGVIGMPGESRDSGTAESGNLALMFGALLEIAAQLAERNERKQFIEFTSVDYNGIDGDKMLINREIIGTVLPAKHDVRELLKRENSKRDCTAISVFGTEELIYVAEPYAEVLTMLGV